MNYKLLSSISLILVVVTTSADSKRTDVLLLPHLNDWQVEQFSGETAYQLIEVDGRYALRAYSHQSASGLVRKLDVDLTKTPYLNWSWMVESVLKDVDETTRQGDDYAARVYVIVSGGVFFWRTRAISYVWASKQPKRSSWPNAYSDHSMMVAVESGSAMVGEWVSEKRNVLEDIRDVLGIDITSINAVAIMTDTDNSKQSATAFYGDINFSSY